MIAKRQLIFRASSQIKQTVSLCLYLFFINSLGTRPYTSVGCFNDSSTERALPELLFDDMENIDLEDWNEYLDTLVCRCAEEAYNAKYTHFAVQSLGRCYSGPNVQATYSQHGRSTNCISTGGRPKDDKFVPCDGFHTGKPCTGGNSTNFVYALEGQFFFCSQ